ncbi:MAG: mandelate racemase/muconate lactonizing enzyme family protein [Thermoleophilia bacterium]|nr:mandelate racemase/muconate lactonizing enzyme family protein [Thermoleophilia bacterium]
MRVTGLICTPVSVPFEGEEVWAYGCRRGVTNVLVELETDEGLTGVGEAVGWPTAEIALAVLESVRGEVLGHESALIRELMQTLYHRRGWHYFERTAGCALAGLEMALWDLAGKAAGLPLHVFFGGAVRERVPYYWYVPSGSPEAMAEAAREGVALGFETLYLKLGFAPGGTVADVHAVRAAVGDGPRLRVDANEAWSVSESLHAIRELEPLRLEFVEQPVSMHDVAGLAEVHERSRVPVAANQTSWDEGTTFDVLVRGLADAIVTDPHQLGGLARFRTLAAVAEIADTPVVKHSFGDLGVSALAAAHVLAACPNAALAHQTHAQLLADDVVVGGVPPLVDGSLALPEAPGIGAELDRERVERYADAYRREGSFSPYEPHGRERAP